MKSLLILVMMSSIIYIPASFAEGTRGGGGTHSCLKYSVDKEGKKFIKSGTSELYDLYEAREAHGYKLVDPVGMSANDLLNKAMLKIYNVNPVYAGAVLDKLKFYTSHKRKLPHKSFNILSDANIAFVDQGCAYMQIAQWRDEYNAIVIDSDLHKIFQKSALNIAALALHEAVYAVERSYSLATDSDRTRKIVGQAFSDANIDLIKKAEIIIPVQAGHFYSWILKALDGEFHSVINVEFWQDQFMKIKSAKNFIWLGELSNKPHGAQIASIASPVELSNGTAVIGYTFYQSGDEKKSTMRLNFEIYEDAHRSIHSKVISKNELNENGRINGNLTLALPYEYAIGQAIRLIDLE